MPTFVFASGCALSAHIQLGVFTRTVVLQNQFHCRASLPGSASSHSLSVNSLHCTKVTCKLAVCHAEKDEEGSKLLQAVNVVTAKTGTTVTLSE